MSDRIQRVMAYVIGMIMVTAVAAAPTLAQKVDPSAERVYEVTANADTIDGFHAIGATKDAAKRVGKLVATNQYGRLPSNIVRPRFRDLKGVPADFKDGMIAWSEVRDKPTIPGGSVAWPDITDKPAALADGVIAWGEIHNPPAVLDDRKVGWGEVQDKPAGFADGVDNVGVWKVETTVVSEMAEIVGGAEAHVFAYCPSGSRVTGGGFIQVAPTLRIHNSYANGGTGWYVHATNPTTVTNVVHAQAICMSVK